MIMIGIIGAMHEEIEGIKNELINLTTKTIGKRCFYIGKRYQQDIILVECGIGKVNAAITATLLVQHFKPSHIYFSGVAGATDERLKIGDIVISTDLIQHDVDLTEFGYKKGQLAWTEELSIPASPALLEKVQHSDIANLHFGRIISGDQFISTKEEKIRLGKAFQALCVDMESASIAQVCTVLTTDFLIIRSISDTVSDESKMEFEKFLPIATKNSKEMIRQLLQ